MYYDDDAGPIPGAAREYALRAVTGVGWRFGMVACKGTSHLLLAVILARLLPVQAFGLVAEALVVIRATGLVAELGLAHALVQRKTLTEAHVRVAMTMVTATGCAMAAILIILAPVAAIAFRTPELTPILRALSLMFVLANIGATPAALLERQLDFRPLFRAELISFAGYAIVGIPLALLHFGVWALVGAALAQALLRTALVIGATGCSLRPTFALAQAKDLVSFGVGLSLTRAMNLIALNADYVVVGRWLGATMLGLYSKAYEIVSLPVAVLAQPVSSVLYPFCSRLQQRHESLSTAYLGVLCVTTSVALPILSVLLVTAPELVRTVFGPQWGGAVVPLQIMTIGGYFRCVSNLADSLARAKGAVYRQALQHGAYAAMVSVGSIVGMRWSIEGVAFGVVGAIGGMYILQGQLVAQLLHLRWRQMLRTQLPGAVLASTVFAVTYIIATPLRRSGLSAPVVLVLLWSAAAVMIAGAFLCAPRAWFGAGGVVIDEVIRVLGKVKQHVIYRSTKSFAGGS